MLSQLTLCLFLCWMDHCSAVDIPPRFDIHWLPTPDFQFARPDAQRNGNYALSKHPISPIAPRRPIALPTPKSNHTIITKLSKKSAKTTTTTSTTTTTTTTTSTFAPTRKPTTPRPTAKPTFNDDDLLDEYLKTTGQTHQRVIRMMSHSSLMTYQEAQNYHLHMLQHHHDTHFILPVSEETRLHQQEDSPSRSVYRELRNSGQLHYIVGVTDDAFAAWLNFPSQIYHRDGRSAIEPKWLPRVISTFFDLPDIAEAAYVVSRDKHMHNATKLQRQLFHIICDAHITHCKKNNTSAKKQRRIILPTEILDDPSVIAMVIDMFTVVADKLFFAVCNQSELALERIARHLKMDIGNKTEVVTRLHKAFRPLLPRVSELLHDVHVHGKPLTGKLRMVWDSLGEIVTILSIAKEIVDVQEKITELVVERGVRSNICVLFTTFSFDYQHKMKPNYQFLNRYFDDVLEYQVSPLRKYPWFDAKLTRSKHMNSRLADKSQPNRQTSKKPKKGGKKKL